MANFNLSANMNLPIPIAGVDPGPDYALNNNNCFTLLDGHDHSLGKGIQITPSGLNLNADVSFLANNAINLRSVRFSPQTLNLSGVSDVGCLYEQGVDLWYNDGSGNQVRITQSGGVAGSPGSISNLTSPASASYVSGNQTFVWQSAANTPANMDFASAIFRNLVANSKGLTLNPPNAMSSNYSLVLPSLPVSTSFLVIDTSGNILGSIPTALGISTGNIANNAVTAAKIAVQTITNNEIAPQTILQSNLAPRTTGVTVAAGGVALSTSSGTFTIGNTLPIAVPNLSVTITTTGRPVQLFLQADGTTSPGAISYNPSGVLGAADVHFVNGVTVLTDYEFSTTSASLNLELPGSLSYLDLSVNGSAGTYTYTIQGNVTTAGAFLTFSNVKLLAYEI